MDTDNVFDLAQEGVYSPAAADLNPHPDLCLGRPSKAQKIQFKNKTNFVTKRNYAILYDLHTAFGPFKSDGLIDLWNQSFSDQINGERKNLLEACLFAEGAILNRRGEKFDHRNEFPEFLSCEPDIQTGLKNITKDPLQLKFRAAISKNPTFVSRCLQDLISNQFQEIYLANRQESGSNWIRVGPFLFIKNKKGEVVSYKLNTFQEIIGFVVLSPREKSKFISKRLLAKDGDMSYLEVIGRRTGPELVNYCRSFMIDSINDFRARLGCKQIDISLLNQSIHHYAGNRGVAMSLQTLNSRYISGAGTAFLKHFFDRSTLSRTARTFGFYARLHQYNAMAVTKDAELLISEFKNEEPILGKLFEKLSPLSREQRFEFIAGVRSYYKKRGLGKSGWRFLKTISPVDTGLIFSHHFSFSVAEDLFAPQYAESLRSSSTFEFLTELGKISTQKPRARLVPYLLRLYEACVVKPHREDEFSTFFNYKVPSSPDPDLHLFRAMARHILNSKDLVINLQHLCTDAIDVLKGLGSDRIRELIGPQKISVDRALRIIQIGHEEMAQKYASENANNKRKWNPVLPTYCVGETVFTELCTETDLVKEGKDMRHCIGSYTEECLAGSVRVFSGTAGLNSQRKLRISVSLSRMDSVKNVWKVGQVRGFANRIANANERSAAQSLAKAFSRAMKDRAKSTLEQ